MKYLTLIIFMFMFTCCRTPKSGSTNSDRPKKTEKTYLPILLNNGIVENKSLALHYGNKAILYFRESSIRTKARENRQQVVLNFLDSAFAISDTARYDLARFDDAGSSPLFVSLYLLLSDDIQNGNLKIYLSADASYASAIYSYLERTELNTIRWFCLPDKSEFYFDLFSIHSSGKIVPKKF